MRHFQIIDEMGSNYKGTLQVFSTIPPKLLTFKWI